MIPKLLISVVHDRPPGIARDAFRETNKRAFAYIARYWFVNFFPDHFTPGARHKYDHQPRGKLYRDNKYKLAARGLVEMGGRVDNVFSGKMRKDLLKTPIIRGFPTRGRVQLRGPNYLKANFKGMGTRGRLWWNRPKNAGQQPNKKKELTTVTQSQKAFLIDLFKKFVAREHAKYLRRRQKKTY